MSTIHNQQRRTKRMQATARMASVVSATSCARRRLIRVVRPTSTSLVVRETPSYISGFESVVAAFGYWPSFHDSPVLTFTRTSEFVELQVEAWEMTSAVDSRGYFVLTKRHEIGFRFSGISSAELDDFIPDNILFELGFSPVAHFQSTGQFQVGLDSAMGGDLCGRFTATSGEVTFIRPSLIEKSAEAAA